MKRSLDRAREQASEALEGMEEAGLGFEDVHGSIASSDDDTGVVVAAGDDEDSNDDISDSKDRSMYQEDSVLVELGSKKANVPPLVVTDDETDKLVETAGTNPSISVSSVDPPKSLISPTAKEVL